VGACLKPEQTISIVYISRTTAPIKKLTLRMDLHCDCARKTISCTSFERVQPLRSDCKSEGQMEARMQSRGLHPTKCNTLQNRGLYGPIVARDKDFLINY